jgi:hypothetical protein
MRRALFPKLIPGGGFCVEIVVSIAGVSPDDLGVEIQDWWTKEWSPENKKWIRIWNRGSKRERSELLLFDDEFSSIPQVISCDRSSLRFRLVGKCTPKWWRDWVVWRILPDLRERFPVIGKVMAIRDCTDFLT